MGSKGSRDEKDRDRVADTDADVEQVAGHAPLATREDQTFDSPVCITFHHFRKRLCDCDGLVAKYAIDGIVQAGILPDDSPEFVSEVRHRQTKSRVEKTVIVIEEACSE